MENLDNVVELYLDLGLLNQVEGMLAAYKLQPGDSKDAYIRSELYILAAKGDIEELKRRFLFMGKVPNSLLQELFSIAEKAKKKNTAYQLAQRLNRLYPSSLNEMLMARALALNGRPKEALKIIRRLKRDGVDIQDNYFYVLVLAAEQDELYKMELKEFIKRAIADKSIQENKKRNWGYVLIGDHLRDLAVPIFQVLAEGKNFSSGDVQTLLDLWGKDLSDRQAAWIVKQAEKSYGEELAGWIAHLVYNKHPAEGALLAEKMGWDNPKVAEIYLEALEGTKERQKLKKALVVMVDREDNPERLGKIGNLSFGLGIYPTAEKAYLKVLNIEPEKADPWKYLGMIKFAESNFHAARFYLQRYLQTEEPGYLGYYYYGEIYWTYNHWQCARKYFHTALHLLTEKENLDPFSELIEAELYYRMGCVTRALCLFEKLIERYPKNASFRVNYANILIILEKYCRANYLLRTAHPEYDKDLDPEQLKDQMIDLELTESQLLQELNRLRAAWRLVGKLLRQYPEEPRIMAMQAQLELLLGRWQLAAGWFDAALQREPQNDTWKKIRREIFCDKARHIFMQKEYKLTGTTQREIKDLLLVYHRINQQFVFKFRADSDQLSLPDTFNPFTGETFRFLGTRYRTEIALECDFLSGLVAEFRGFLAREGLGAGLDTTKTDFYGISRMQLWYHRQTWEFVQSIIDFGLEDRIDFYRSFNLGPRTEIFGEGGYRWYYLAHFGLSATTYTFTTGVNYRLNKRNIVARQFGDGANVYLNFYVDAQYPTFEKKVFSPVLGQEVIPLDVEKRETWVWQMSFNKIFCPTFWMEGFAGASWDRAFNGDVAPIGGFVTYIGTKCGPQLRFQYFRTFSSQFENQSVDRFIADFKIPY